MLSRSRLDEFPLVDLLLAAGLIALILSVAESIQTPSGTRKDESLLNRAGKLGTDLWSKLPKISRASRANIALTVLIAVAAYLSLSAIAAVSLLKPTQANPDLTIVRLAEQLDKAQITDKDDDDKEDGETRFSLLFPADVPPLPTLSVESEAANATVANKETDVSQVADSFELITSSIIGKQSLERYQRQYEESTNAYRRLRLTVMHEQDRLKEVAVSHYGIRNTGRLGGREQATHFGEINRWYIRSLSRMFGDVRNCRAAIDRFRISTISLVSSQGHTSWLNRLPNALIFRTVDESSRDASDACGANPGEWSDPLPERGDFGRYLGVFGVATGWILATESLPLALIIGLVGFGLFGALVSSFIRAKEGNRTKLNLFAVVCIGASAAIVTFLAAYGGIAIVSQSSEHDLNPYVLFATCLVAAVFGEDVWRWARSRFIPSDGAGNAEENGNARKAAAKPKKQASAS